MKFRTVIESDEVILRSLTHPHVKMMLRRVDCWDCCDARSWMKRLGN